MEPENPRPYTENELERARNWLLGLSRLGRPLSQQDLSELFSLVADEHGSNLDLRMEWLDSGWCAFPGSVRGSSISVNLLLNGDAEACRQRDGEIIRASLPMTYRAEMEVWPRLRGTLIAPANAINYDPQRGAEWAK